MGSFEIFSWTSGQVMTIFALLCLGFSAFFASKEKSLFKPIVFLSGAIVLDFFGTWVEAVAVADFEAGKNVELHMTIELALFLLSMILMSIAASYFIASSSDRAHPLPVWILGGLGLGAVVWFTLVVPSGDIVNKMRFIFPLAALLYLSVGLISRFSTPEKNGYVTALLVTLGLIAVLLLRFIGVVVPWYITPMSYFIYALSFLMMKADAKDERLGKAELKIEKYNRKLEEIIKASPFPIIISRLGDDRIILVNDNASKLFGIDPEQPERYHLKDFFADSDNRRLLLERLEEQKEVHDFEVLVRTPFDPTPFWLLTSANIVEYNYNMALYSAFQDITSRKNRETILQNQAIRDPLTSLFNRRYFESEAKKLIEVAQKENKPYSVLMLDADLFKKVNDTYGHKIGDKVLIELAAKAVKALRDGDIVARYGGEEFVVFLADTAADQADKVAERLREAIASVIVYSDDNQEVRFTVSIGVSSSEISDNVDTLVKTADAALYRAKQNGRNRVEVFKPEDLVDFEHKKLAHSERQTEHPVFDAENKAEISLLDGKAATEK